MGKDSNWGAVHPDIEYVQVKVNDYSEIKEYVTRLIDLYTRLASEPFRSEMQEVADEIRLDAYRDILEEIKRLEENNG